MSTWVGLRSGALHKTRHGWTVMCLDPLLHRWIKNQCRMNVHNACDTVPSTVRMLHNLCYSSVYSACATVPTVYCCRTQILFIHFWSNVRNSKVWYCSFVPCLKQGTRSQSTWVTQWFSPCNYISVSSQPWCHHLNWIKASRKLPILHEDRLRREPRTRWCHGALNHQIVDVTCVRPQFV
jgi:hypothetical protein